MSDTQVPFFGELYRRTTAPLLRAEVTRAEAAFIRRTLPSERRVLDLGCGEGRHLAALQGAPGVRFGLDFDPVAVGAARAWATLVQGDLRRLPFADGSFDAIYCW
ncbi:MAG: class I SAM-dependent methyltransferase, partial [Myxococcales bacterium]